MSTTVLTVLAISPIEAKFRTDPQGFFPYLREEETLARPWVRPGTPGLEHRIGGLAKEHITGNVSYSPANNEQMVRIRARKVAGIAREIPPTKISGAQEGDVLVVGWGGTYGALEAAVNSCVERGKARNARIEASSSSSTTPIRRCRGTAMRVIGPSTPGRFSR